MNNSFGYVSTLQYRLKAQARQIDEFKSGERYRKLEAEYKAIIRSLERKIKKLEEDLADAHSETISVRNQWFEVMEDLIKEHERKLAKKDRMIKSLRSENARLLHQKEEILDKCREKQRKIYELGTLLEEQQALNQKLTAQVNRDFQNSSIPSSLQGPGRKKIPNSREKTGRQPGGQPGHKGHCRRKLPVTETHEIPAPAELTENPDYYETGKIIRKQKIVIRMSIEVIEYTAKEYRNRQTGARAHAPFPEGFVNEVNYDGSIKALAFLLGNECNVSHGKIRKLISELTNGQVILSDGLINGLCEEFSSKTEAEKREILEGLMTSPVMNADFTNANVNGKSAQVLILASPVNDVALYIAREKKGHAGVRDTPLENYVGTVIHDHDLTFYSYGRQHQECTQHDCRYLIGSKQNEPDLTWSSKMHELFKEMLHYRNHLRETEELDPAIIEGFEKRYDEYLDLAEKEYEDNPPSDYYREGYNLFQRLRKYKENELLFLHDKMIPSNNSYCERLARVYKRKQKQAITLRSQQNLGYICDGLSIVYLLRNKCENVYQAIAEIYERKRPPKIKAEVIGISN